MPRNSYKPEEIEAGRTCPGHDRQDVPVFGAAGLPADRAAGEAEAGAGDAGD